MSRTARPPITPPTMAPIGVEDFLEAGVDVLDPAVGGPPLPDLDADADADADAVGVVKPDKPRVGRLVPSAACTSHELDEYAGQARFVRVGEYVVAWTPAGLSVDHCEARLA